MVAVAYKRFKISDLKGKLLVFWKTGHWGEVVAYKRWSKPEVRLYYQFILPSTSNSLGTPSSFSATWNEYSRFWSGVALFNFEKSTRSGLSLGRKYHLIITTNISNISNYSAWCVLNVISTDNVITYTVYRNCDFLLLLLSYLYLWIIALKARPSFHDEVKFPTSTEGYLKQNTYKNI